MLDRIDLIVELGPTGFDDLHASAAAETSAAVAERVERTREFARGLGRRPGSTQVSPREGIDGHCMTGDALQFLRQVATSLHLTARGLHRTIAPNALPVARTIADMDRSEQVLSKHMGEAVQYRGGGWSQR